MQTSPRCSNARQPSSLAIEFCGFGSSLRMIWVELLQQGPGDSGRDKLVKRNYAGAVGRVYKLEV